VSEVLRRGSGIKPTVSLFPENQSSLSSEGRQVFVVVGRAHGDSTGGWILAMHTVPGRV
jgi:hypothetical protein